MCRPNAILTLKEYLENYATTEAKNKGEKIIRKYLQEIADNKRRRETEARLIKTGERDLYF